MDTPRPKHYTQEKDTEHSASGNRLRLTNRGRAVLGALGAAGLAAVIAMLSPEGSSPADYSQRTEVVTVESGQGLLDVAHQVGHSDEVDIRDVEEHIKKMPANAAALEDGLQAGEKITIPVSVGHR